MSETNPAQACMDTPYPECPPGTNRFEWILHVQAPLVREARQAANERRRQAHDQDARWEPARPTREDPQAK